MSNTPDKRDVVIRKTNRKIMIYCIVILSFVVLLELAGLALGSERPSWRTVGLLILLAGVVSIFVRERQI